MGSEGADTKICRQRTGRTLVAAISPAAGSKHSGVGKGRLCSGSCANPLEEEALESVVMVKVRLLVWAGERPGLRGAGETAHAAYFTTNLRGLQ
jgi:hypothetical protein